MFYHTLIVTVYSLWHIGSSAILRCSVQDELYQDTAYDLHVRLVLNLEVYLGMLHLRR